MEALVTHTMQDLFREAVEPPYRHCAHLFTDVRRGAYGPWCHLHPTAGSEWCRHHDPTKPPPRSVPTPKPNHERPRPLTHADALWVAWWFTALGGAEAFNEFRAATDATCCR